MLKKKKKYGVTLGVKIIFIKTRRQPLDVFTQISQYYIIRVYVCAWNLKHFHPKQSVWLFIYLYINS